MTTLSTEQAASGKYSLKVVDDSDKLGLSVFATRVAIPGAGNYALQGKAFPVSGNGLGIYVRVLDKNGQAVGAGDTFQRAAPTQPTGRWVPFSIDLFTGNEAAFLEVWIHSYSAAKVTAYLDDMAFTHSTQELKPPWQGTYKIKPHEKSKLTAADVVGPDGIVYPDWRYAGVPGGIPNVRVVARAAEFGAVADDQRDDSMPSSKAAAVQPTRVGSPRATV